MTNKSDKAIQEIAKLIEGTEYENNVYIAGGWCRDQAIGRPNKDIDFVVNLPGGGIFFATWLTKKLGVYKKDSNPIIYGRFGTACFRAFDTEFESVMSRKEAYEIGSRKPSVKFGSIHDDVYRRDFTINSLLYNISTRQMIDITGQGLSDIMDKLIKTPINPDNTFIEDPLRMLRAVRFSCVLGFDIDKTTLDSIAKNSKHLQSISYERINAELTKILTSDYPSFGINTLVETQLMRYIIPEIYELVGLEQNKYHDKDAFGHTMNVLQSTPPELIYRMSALLHDIGKGKTKEPRKDGQGNSFIKHHIVGAHIAKKILRKLKYSNDFIEDVAFIVQNHMRTKDYGSKAEDVTDKTLRKLIADSGERLGPLLEVCHADNLSHGAHSMPDQVENIVKRIAEIKNRKEPVKLPITGNDIIEEFNVKQGKDVGDILKKAEDLFMEDPNINKKTLIDKLRIIVNNLNK